MNHGDYMDISGIRFRMGLKSFQDRLVGIHREPFRRAIALALQTGLIDTHAFSSRFIWHRSISGNHAYRSRISPHVTFEDCGITYSRYRSECSTGNEVALVQAIAGAIPGSLLTIVDLNIFPIKIQSVVNSVSDDHRIRCDIDRIQYALYTNNASERTGL